ncbi:MAG: GNAT family N-acetyltransferase [Hyphomicrobiales bacterium]|nr:GNAT family N-acetyltransferase [Hyphomicrobiales bacterium]
MPSSTPDTVRTTTLELNAAPRIYPTIQTKSKLAIMQVPEIPLPFYRFLYGEIGKSHYWYLRNHLSDRELAKILHSQNTKISVLYHDGAPAGFAELNLFQMPDLIEIVYFGLCPQYIGRGLGKWFLGQIVRSAWEEHPQQLKVSTDTLDHTHALPLYQKMGFTPISFKEEKMEDWLQKHS